MSCQNTMGGGTKFSQTLVNQTPKFANQVVFSRKMKINRTTKKTNKIKFL